MPNCECLLRYVCVVFAVQFRSTRAFAIEAPVSACTTWYWQTGVTDKFHILFERICSLRAVNELDYYQYAQSAQQFTFASWMHSLACIPIAFATNFRHANMARTILMCRWILNYRNKSNNRFENQDKQKHRIHCFQFVLLAMPCRCRYVDNLICTFAPVRASNETKVYLFWFWKLNYHSIKDKVTYQVIASDVPSSFGCARLAGAYAYRTNACHLNKSYYASIQFPLKDSFVPYEIKSNQMKWCRGCRFTSARTRPK